MSFEFQTLVVLIHCFFPSPVSSLFGLKLSTVLILYIISNTVLIGGDDSLRVTPVPIPNTEVKPLDADGTAGEAQWESRLSPPFSIFYAG